MKVKKGQLGSSRTPSKGLNFEVGESCHISLTYKHGLCSAFDCLLRQTKDCESLTVRFFKVIACTILQIRVPACGEGRQRAAMDGRGMKRHVKPHRRHVCALQVVTGVSRVLC